MLIKTKEHQTLIQNFGCALDGVTNEFKDDIGQLARYGRHIKIRKKLKLTDEMAKCLIIYPLKGGKNELSNLWDNASYIAQFKDFKKIGVELPMHDAQII